MVVHSFFSCNKYGAYKQILIQRLPIANFLGPMLYTTRSAGSTVKGVLQPYEFKFQISFDRSLIPDVIQWFQNGKTLVIDKINMLFHGLKTDPFSFKL